LGPRRPDPLESPDCLRSATVHLGSTFEEIAASERAVNEAKFRPGPFVLVPQQSLFDPTRAPAGRHTGWAYCHVPDGSTVDMTEPIERQIERFAPGFRERILARHAISSRDLEAHNATMIGGDFGGGANDIWQFIFRPTLRFDPYSTPNERPSSAPARHRRAAVSTACAGTGQPGRRWRRG
jgi:phytoene dehydrogenase-like protein